MKPVTFALFTLVSSALCREPKEFEQKHMHQSRQVEISDEVAFFKYHDINKDGFWDEKELRAMYGFESDPDSIHIKSIIDGVFEDMDKNRDRLISQDEYTNAKLPQINQRHDKFELKTQRKQWVASDDSPSANEIKPVDAKANDRGTIPKKFRA
ncbi:hypothetical protein A0J61_01794 [Choanephora cucurbitarum]|uniref:SPARC/Testican calcium-binding domain-containing protein n=1 Tax=Choanephora cucurbitarum TaxID=101091 RepID=A0A1C7NME7_9FUNG|nr:hypothetical protein A0J61_01794 [Choanephora cucurbitarum]